MEISTENLWKILDSKCTIPEALSIFGYPQKEIDEMVDGLKDVGVSLFPSASIKIQAYKLLLEKKGISDSEIFNFGGPKEAAIRQGDLGIKGNEVYCYRDGEWQYCFESM